MKSFYNFALHRVILSSLNCCLAAVVAGADVHRDLPTEQSDVRQVLSNFQKQSPVLIKNHFTLFGIRVSICV